jgi:iron uptake system EfeUOB component EfeO/EfeM
MHGERNPPTEPPCEDCRVDLKEENDEAARIFQIVRGQIRTRFNGQIDEVVDLDFNAVQTVMDLYQVKNQRDVFDKVRSAFYFFLQEGREE